MTIDAATWSAVAATFAALSSFLIMRIQRANLRESVRPELVITGWGRESRGNGEAAHDVITFAAIRNVGKGPALHVYMNCFHEENRFPLAVMSTTRYAIIVQNEKQELKGEIIIAWKNVKERDGGKFLPITITIYCWDANDVRHETIYELLVTNPPMMCAATDELAPGLALTTRRTVRVPVWWLKSKKRMRQCIEWLKQRWKGLKRVRRTDTTHSPNSAG